ncbi:excalibur calcium-binding domain-containing protein [Nocardia vinacea]
MAVHRGSKGPPVVLIRPFDQRHLDRDNDGIACE